MAESNVTNLNRACAREAERLRGKLTECDALGQDAAGAIIAITRGARQMLAVDAAALTQVLCVLGALETYAGELAIMAAFDVDPPAAPRGQGSEAERLRGKLTECDALAQRSSATIIAFSRAARQMLAPHPDALTQVYRLLASIEKYASELENRINAVAEEEGANWVDQNERALTDRLWAQHHALRSVGPQEKRNV